MNFKQLDFSVFCIGSVAEALNMEPQRVYHLLKDSNILMGYIVASYDVLHTFSKDYLTTDIISYMKEKGVIQ